MMTRSTRTRLWNSGTTLAFAWPCKWRVQGTWHAHGGALCAPVHLSCRKSAGRWKIPEQNLKHRGEPGERFRRSARDINDLAQSGATFLELVIAGTGAPERERYVLSFLEANKIFRRSLPMQTRSKGPSRANFWSAFSGWRSNLAGGICSLPPEIRHAG